MTTPSIVPVEFDGTYKDFLKCKVDRDGCVRTQYKTVTIPAITVVTTIVGLVPFQKGFRLNYNATSLLIGDLDTATNVTFDVGYVYETGSAETDDPNAFATVLTTAQAGGLIVFDEPTTGLPFVAADNGWISITMSGGSTTTEGALSGQVVGSYDGLAASN